MRIKIVEGPVRQNVESFLRILRRVKEKQLQKSPPPEELFKAWLNTQTGQLSFAEEESSHAGQKEWKPVTLGYQYDQSSGEIQFIVQVAEEKEAAFYTGDLAPIAFRVFRETLKIFSDISRQLKGPSDLSTKVSVLSKLEITAEISHADRNILIDLWHHADRMQAESLLMDKPVGTYLFRKDPYAEVLEEQLERELQKPVQCFTLTWSEPNRKISDWTLAHVEQAWQIYDDDPSLSQKKYTELNDIVELQKNILRYPLYRDTNSDVFG